jgi:hypothetical protein
MPGDPNHQVAFLGDRGSLLISGSQYSIKDPSGAEVAKARRNAGDVVHLQNFLDAIRGTAPLNAEIEEGFKSTLLCHLATSPTARAGRSSSTRTRARWSATAKR